MTRVFDSLGGKHESAAEPATASLASLRGTTNGRVRNGFDVAGAVLSPASVGGNPEFHGRAHTVDPG